MDLIDLDLQGAEAAVLTKAADLLDAKVKRLHIGTHSASIEKALRKLFSTHGWDNLNDYPGMCTNDTLYGKIQFEDGVQTWINPRL